MFTNYLLRHPLLHPLCGLRPGLFTTGNRESTIRRYRRIAGGHEVSTNRVRTEFNDRTYDYVLAHTREPEVLRCLREETSSMQGASMQISPEQGQFMAQLAMLLGARNYLEVGTFTGYSSLAVALVLPKSAKVVTLDRDPKPVKVAQKYWEIGNVAELVDCRIGPAVETLLEVEKDYGNASFDMGFIDADKQGYRAYYEHMLKLIRPGGLILVDNVLWYGQVADPEVTDNRTQSIRDLNDFMLADERVDFTIVPIGDGVAVCRVRDCQ